MSKETIDFSSAARERRGLERLKAAGESLISLFRSEPRSNPQSSIDRAYTAGTPEFEERQSAALRETVKSFPS